MSDDHNNNTPNQAPEVEPKSAVSVSENEKVSTKKKQKATSPSIRPDSVDRDPIQRQKGERTKHHRAFLLYAMQNPTARTCRPISDAIGCSHTSVLQWRKKYNWDDRARSQTADVVAQQMYRALYMGRYGIQEVSHIQQNITAPVSATTPVPKSVADSVQVSLDQVKDLDDSKHDKEMRKKQIMILDAAIGYVAQGIKDSDIKRNIRDLPILIGLRNELSDFGNTERGGAVVVESLRVKDAKANGSNIVEAMYEDALELTMILRNLKGTGEAHQQVHGEANEQ